MTETTTTATATAETVTLAARSADHAAELCGMEGLRYVVMPMRI